MRSSAASPPNRPPTLLLLLWFVLFDRTDDVLFWLLRPPPFPVPSPHRDVDPVNPNWRRGWFGRRACGTPGTGWRRSQAFSAVSPFLPLHTLGRGDAARCFELGSSSDLRSPPPRSDNPNYCRLQVACLTGRVLSSGRTASFFFQPEPF